MGMPRSMPNLKGVFCMNTIRMLLFLIVAGLSACAEDIMNNPGTKPLDSGGYGLNMKTDAMEGKDRDITFPAQIHYNDKNEIIIESNNLNTLLTMRGVIVKDTIKFGITGPERDKIISLYHVGKIESKQKASGEFLCFADGKVIFTGTWVLIREQDEVKEPVGNNAAMPEPDIGETVGKLIRQIKEGTPPECETAVQSLGAMGHLATQAIVPLIEVQIS